MAAQPGERCKFETTLDIDYFDPENESLLRITDMGQWRCPHHRFEPDTGPADGYDFCPFHIGHNSTEHATVPEGTAELCVWLITGNTEQVSGLGPLPSALQAYARRECESQQFEMGERTQFIGAVFDEFELDYRAIDGPSNAPIDFRDATVTESASFQSVKFAQPLLFSGAVFNCPTTFVDATFANPTEFRQTRFEGRADFHRATFAEWADFDDATFEREVNFRGVDFDRGIVAVDTCFNRAADFMSAEFAEVANFTGATFRRGAVFSSTTFFGNATFRETSFTGPVELGNRLVEYTDVDDRWDRISVDKRSVQDAAVVFRNLTCEGTLNLAHTSLHGNVYITSSTIGGPIIATGITVHDDPIELNFSGSETIRGRVGAGTEPISYDFTEATLGELELGDSNADSLRFARTTFDGFDFGKHLDLFTTIDWQLHRADTPFPERENMYLRAKNGAKRVGEGRAVSEFYIRELRYRRAGYRKRIYDEFPGFEAAKAFAKFCGSVALAATCGYGERPLRPVITSAGVVGLFAILYAAIGLELPYENELKYLTFSFESFVALLIGQPEPTSSFVSLLAALEGFIGAFMIALFVFTFTRSVSK
mgnify:CR=1 FL=1